jgi:hypothetical protein
MGAPEAFWHDYYDAQNFLLPNAILDIFLLTLLKFGIGIAASGKVFLIITYGLFTFGFWCLSSACGSRSGLTVPLAIILFYNWAFFLGLANYVFGIALMLALLGAWLASEERLLCRLGIVLGGATALFFCHLVPALLFVGVIGCLELYDIASTQRGMRSRRLVRCGSPAALVLIGVLLQLSPSGKAQLTFSYGGTGSLASFAYWKAGIFARTLLGGAFASDVVVAAFGVTFLLVLVLTCRVGISTRMVLVTAALVALTLAAPQRLGTGSLFDHRIAIVPVILAAAALRVSAGRRGGLQWALAVLILGVLLRSTILAVSWQHDSALFADLDRVLATLPPQSTLLTGYGRSPKAVSWREWWSPALSNSAVLAVFHGVFVPTVFAFPTQQPLVLKPAWRQWDAVADLSTPERLGAFAERARQMCRGTESNKPGAGIAILVLYPSTFVRELPAGELLSELNSRFAILKYC